MYVHKSCFVLESKYLHVTQQNYPVVHIYIYLTEKANVAKTNKSFKTKSKSLKRQLHLSVYENKHLRSFEVFPVCFILCQNL